MMWRRAFGSLTSFYLVSGQELQRRRPYRRHSLPEARFCVRLTSVGIPVDPILEFSVVHPAPSNV